MTGYQSGGRYTPATAEALPPWPGRPACTGPGVDPQDFHPVSWHQRQRAVKVCDRCPVQERCLIELYSSPLLLWTGIWAGRDAEQLARELDPAGRDRDRRRRLALLLAVHGR